MLVWGVFCSVTFVRFAKKRHLQGEQNAGEVLLQALTTNVYCCEDGYFLRDPMTAEWQAPATGPPIVRKRRSEAPSDSLYVLQATSLP